MANKKINQLVLKTTIQPTDLFPLGDATTGQLFKKTVAELQAAIGGAVISVNGLVGTVVLDTDDIQELASPTNRYFTEARARAAISLTTTGNSGASTYSNSTGVLNVPTYTLAGLGGITASFLSGGTGITYNSDTGVISYSGTVFTDASIRALVSAGTGLSYNSSTGVFSYSGTVYTDSSIRALLSGTAPISYNNSTGAISISQATTSTNGYLSSTDWNTFNNKQSTLTLGNLTEATSSVLTITGGTGSVVGSGTSIQVKQASSTVSGFLSSTDWNTFNGKQNVITNPVTGTGTTNYVTKWTSSSAIGNSSIFDDGTSVFVNATSGGYNTPRLLVNNGSGVSIGFQVIADAGGRVLRFQTSDYNNSNTGSALRIGFGAASGNTYTTINAYSAGESVTNNLILNQGGGNVGIGITAPSQPLSVEDTILIKDSGSSASQLIFGDAANDFAGRIFYNHGSDAMQFFVNADERMRITSGGNVGIGTTAPVYSLHVVGTGLFRGTGNAGRIECEDTNGGGVNITINPGFAGTGTPAVQIQTNHPLIFATNNTDRGRITAGGNFLFGTSSDNGERLYVSGSIRATGSITANSDARLKKNIERIENALEKVGQISGYTYNTIYDEDRHAGVIAQEIDKVLPEIVNKGNDGLMGVEYGNISALLIEAIKEQKVLIESLQAKVEALSK